MSALQALLQQGVLVGPPLSVDQGASCEFGCAAVVCRFESGSGWEAACANGGRPDQGCCTSYDILIEVQPYQAKGEKLKFEADGIFALAEYRFYFEPPSNVIGGERFYLRTADSRFVVGGFDASVNNGYGDLVFWLGEYWLVSNLQNWTASSCCDAPCDAVVCQEGVLMRWKNCWQERVATVENDVSALCASDEWVTTGM